MMFYIIAIALVFTLGYLAQKIGLCMVRGVAEATAGKPLFLVAILLSGSFAWISICIATYLEMPSPFRSSPITALAGIGGLLFGIGAGFNDGCGISTISKLARGRLDMGATIAGWLLGWILLANFSFIKPEPHTDAAFDWHCISLMVVSLVLVVVALRGKKEARRIWLTMLTIGLMASLVFLYEPRWTPSGFLNAVSLSIWNRDSATWPSLERFVLIAALVGGMIIAARVTHAFKLEPPTLRQFIKHLSAGVVMGLGASLASGGNDSQLLLALPALSPAGALSILCMVTGIYMVKRMISRFTGGGTVCPKI